MKSLKEFIENTNNKLNNVNDINLFNEMIQDKSNISFIKHFLKYHLTAKQIEDCLYNYNLNYIKENCWDEESLSYNKYQCLLYESLFHHDKEAFINKCKELKWFIKCDSAAKHNDYSSKESLMLVIAKDCDLDKLSYIIEVYGYYASGIDENYGDYIGILVHPFTPELKEVDDYVYRLVSKRSYEISKKKGLIPRKNTMQYGVYIPRRVYCLLNTIPEDDLIESAKRLDNQSRNKHNILMKIDVKQFNKDHNTKLRFFEDPNFSGDYAVFTKEYIPAKYISIERELNY